ncbi:sperm surface protein Sp17 [Mycetomoellerius zeteki]|uniref:sperm surface protein Sp17 n=1 Tax=Mycetomoellerius zeteki TaxID=64791 RepID=UPI00084E9873|nr:PREDICTED: sperm surface protein Sp17 [Trachymyrmex zeteki]
MGCNTSKENVQPAVEEAKEGDSIKNGDISKAAENSATKAESDEGKENDADEEKEAAATKIQAAFRGHHARKSLRVSETASKETRTAEKSSESTEEPTQEQLQEEFRADDQDLCNAAKKIQATFRGHMSRKEQAAAKSAMNMVESATAKIEEKMQDAVHELEGIDLADPDLHKAATKIQASFRGHKVRQEVNIHSTADDSKK